MFVEKTDSTNTLMREMIAKGEWPKNEHFLRAGFQTAGRGQTGNKWESEEGKNILCSFLLPPIDEEPFYYTVAVSVAVYQVLENVLENETRMWLEKSDVPFLANLIDISRSKVPDLKIKWPNDIYYKDQKIAGILIEGGLTGSKMDYAIAGIGVNVNQTRWRSAPNAISIKSAAHSISSYEGEFDIEALMKGLDEKIQQVFKISPRVVWDRYIDVLYRIKGGPWPFVERTVDMAPTMNAPKGTKGTFKAWIIEVRPNGELVLQDEQGEQRFYHFKQIRYVV
ncbi:MAG: biotin--[acetyl-CoA-carboxylase] ligase [Paludibacteraceae bacterium]|nr:biotin--[acetyl-CoA-carboxylase] ligase [Paludibacteraceae bacterium]